MREAKIQYASDRVLVEGKWTHQRDVKYVERRIRLRLLPRTFETLAFWALVAVLGFGLLGLTVLII